MSPQRLGLLLAGLSTTPSSDRLLPGPSLAPSAEDMAGPHAPYAVSHRGFGANDGGDPSRPIENTLDAFRAAFRAGVRVVELDLRRTADGKIVVLHDEVLAHGTCVSALTYAELRARRPYVPLFRSVLDASRELAPGGFPGGAIFAEIKVPRPGCDDANTSEQAAVSEGALVAAVIADIRQARMAGRVILNSESPSILRQAAIQAPGIRRALTLHVMQLLKPAAVAAITGLPVVKIRKNDCGLDWYNIGTIARLPAMPGADFAQRFGSFIAVTLAGDLAQTVSLDKRVLFQAGNAAASLAAAVHANGLELIVWTVDSRAEWDFVARAGVDGITTNNVALGLANQAPLPGVGHARLELVDAAPRSVESRTVHADGTGRQVSRAGRDQRPDGYPAGLGRRRDQARADAWVTR